MRNFGGPEVLQQLMYNASGASDLPAALNFGIKRVRTKAGMTIPLTNAAVMLSDRTDTEDYIRASTGTDGLNIHLTATATGSAP